MIKKLWIKFINFWKWIWKECRDWRTLIVFIIVWLILMSPMIVGYILYFVTKNEWHLTYATAWILFWAGPFTPTIPICLAVTFAIKKIKEKRTKKKNASVN